MDSAALRTLANLVVETLTGWYVEGSALTRLDYIVDLRHRETGMLIGIMVDRKNPDKLEIKGYVPNGERVIEYGLDNIRHWVPTLSIGVSKNKRAEAIARDIKNRLLPDYEPNFTERYKQAKSTVDYNVNLKARKERLLSEFPELKANNPNDVFILSFYTSAEGYGYGDIMLSGDNARLDLRSLPYSKMREVLEVLFSK